ncbi:hypothetical protein [Klebsiella pneumoniae]|jgi:hypothetical protein|uniref:hypothetical protein n=1 Tax=Klebsiella pneumoniae TaxID=573 RepID=UPI001D28D536|nr:hypothetical protein [Klebsiella pneumoniae]CAH6345402.1 hypothetical protein AI2934V1_2926 [Klebsiella pneumoniae]
MNAFSTVSRNYPVSGGISPSKKKPSAAKQADGFAPTYINAVGKLIKGDPVDMAELNFIFNDLYAQAAHIDLILTAKGK